MHLADSIQATARGSGVPLELKEFWGYHAGESFMVCGCGSSLSHAIAPERFITIGVNDVGRLFHPDYLVVLNPPAQFNGDRFRYVERSRASAIFTQLDLKLPHPHIVKLRLGQRGGAHVSDPNSLPYTRNSPYLALCLAVHMGARRIGLIGVDFTDNHFFAATGRHSLAGDVAQIDREYRQLYANCSRQGVEIFNLSAESRLTGLPKQSPQQFMEEALSPGGERGRKIFFVNYNFLSCGDVFHHGLAHAAEELGAEWNAAVWDDPKIPEKIERFNPDLVFVVHGRKFSTRWVSLLERRKSAIWLLDEPYEVDDTSRFSRLFGTVFVNDPNTLHRHPNAHYLPVCYDPKAHFYLAGEERTCSLGFIGGHNPQREQALSRLARRGLLSYVVGGPWSDPAVQSLCRSTNIPASETASFYRTTRIVLNLFRTKHHYNRAGAPATSLNPRVYEGMGCGALVISEHRAELDTLCPEMPVFHTMEEMEALVERYLRDEDQFVRVRRACIRRFAPHTYAARLASVLKTCLGSAECAMPTADHVKPAARVVVEAVEPRVRMEPLSEELVAAWDVDPECVRTSADGDFLLEKPHDHAPGSERGLVGKASMRNLLLEFDLQLEADSIFVAKIHQAEAKNQLSNSYHVMCHGSRAYLARHSHIFHQFTLPLKTWFRMSLSYLDGEVIVRRHGTQLAQFKEQKLECGHAFLGIKGGTARLRDIRLQTPEAVATRETIPGNYEILHLMASDAQPRVSIVTTVYDRVQCLERCLQSVRKLNFRDFEHIIVADAPPRPIMEQIVNLVENSSVASDRGALARLKQRKNDWGISPAAAGVSLARGKYVCFLSDDNGYVAHHFDKLVEALDHDPNLGFVYSSCLYAGRATLCSAAPRAGGIDLGQPLFRRELFTQYLGGTIPFHEFGWDWRVIEAFMRNGTRWRHIDDATFVFRLANYPHLHAEAIQGVQ